MSKRKAAKLVAPAHTFTAEGQLAAARTALAEAYRKAPHLLQLEADFIAAFADDKESDAAIGAKEALAKAWQSQSLDYQSLDYTTRLLLFPMLEAIALDAGKQTLYLTMLANEPLRLQIEELKQANTDLAQGLKQKLSLYLASTSERRPVIKADLVTLFTNGGVSNAEALAAYAIEAAEHKSVRVVLTR